MKSDIYTVFEAIATSKSVDIEWHNFATLGIVLASKGYPDEYKKGFEIKGLESVDAQIYHMGTECREGKLLTAGGRVMIVVAKGDTLREAQAKALSEIKKIECENLFHRTDIGNKGIK